MRLTGADPFTLLFAEAVRAPRVGMIVPRIMLAHSRLFVFGSTTVKVAP
jgi:hypothetical protein